MSHGSGTTKLGTKIATIVSNAVVATHQKLLHVKHRLAMKVFSDISDVISEEVHDTLGPILRQLHAGVPEDSQSHSALKFMATQHGQLQALAGTTALGQGLLWPISALINNELAPVVYEGVSSNPHQIPDAGSIAAMGARGFINDPSYIDGMAKNGFNGAWANALKQINEQYPDAGTMLDLVRRGFIARDTFIEWSIHNGVPVSVAEQWVKLIDVPLTPADAALALLRGNINRADAVNAAAAWGVTEKDFDVLVNNTGDPLGLEQLLEARRRGFIDDARLERGILQSRVRNEWIDVAKRIAYSPISVADAVQASVQNHISQAEASSIAGQNGLEPGMFEILYQTAGEPLSRTEMEQLYNRGQATKDDVLQALRESRLKDKYGEKAFELHSRLMQPGELADAVLYGAMTHAQATQKAVEIGYSADDASVLVSSAINRKLETQRMGVVRAVEQLYENNAISQENANTIIGSMGFEPAEASFIVQAAEFRRQEKLVAAAISAVRSKYIAHHIDQGATSAALDAIGIPHQQRDFMLKMWGIEHDANVHPLTPAQVIKGNALGLITDADALRRLTDMGYKKDDATLLLKGA